MTDCLTEAELDDIYAELTSEYDAGDADPDDDLQRVYETAYVDAAMAFHQAALRRLAEDS